MSIQFFRSHARTKKHFANGKVLNNSHKSFLSCKKIDNKTDT